MQERHIRSIIHEDGSFTRADSEWFEKKAAQISEEATNLPPNMTTPTAKQLEDIYKFRKDFMGSHPRASDRQIRRAIEKKFKIKILPDTK